MSSHTEHAPEGTEEQEFTHLGGEDFEQRAENNPDEAFFVERIANLKEQWRALETKNDPKDSEKREEIMRALADYHIAPVHKNAHDDHHEHDHGDPKTAALKEAAFTWGVGSVSSILSFLWTHLVPGFLKGTSSGSSGNKSHGHGHKH